MSFYKRKVGITILYDINEAFVCALQMCMLDNLPVVLPFFEKPVLRGSIKRRYVALILNFLNKSPASDDGWDLCKNLQEIIGV